MTNNEFDKLLNNFFKIKKTSNKKKIRKKELTTSMDESRMKADEMEITSSV